MYVIIAAGVIIAFFIAFRIWSRYRRRKALFAKYQDQNTVDMIVRRSIWQGQTQEQLIDSLGRPLDVDQKVLKTKTVETWKYHRTGTNRFALRITLEGGVVVGWQKKG